MKRNSNESHKICNTLQQFTALIENEEILDFETVGKSFLDVTFRPKSKNQTNCFTNIGIAVHIVNYAKMYVDLEIMKLKEKFKSMKVYMINCDALAFRHVP